MADEKAMDAAADLLRDTLIPAARRGLDELVEEMQGHELVDLQRALIYMVFFDRLHRAQGGVRFKVDLPALRSLERAAEKGPASAQEAVLGLTPEATFQALGELIHSHRDRAIKRQNAQFN